MESQRTFLTVIVVVILIGTITLNKPSFIGYVPSGTYSQELNITLDHSQRFNLSAPKDRLGINSLSISATVSGSGLVNVYLSDGTEKKLVFSNKKTPTRALSHVTGLSSTLIIEPQEKLDLIESLPDGETTQQGSFSKVCLQTCVLDFSLSHQKTLFLDVILEPGTTIHIDELIFS